MVRLKLAGSVFLYARISSTLGLYCYLAMSLAFCLCSRMFSSDRSNEWEVIIVMSLSQQSPSTVNILNVANARQTTLHQVEKRLLIFCESFAVFSTA